ncbi:MAG: hypothetical protein NZL93_02165 [Chthoniobacterales bacterium]|nr:hypothetical protein [Chthoniobacterales bacterium]
MALPFGVEGRSRLSAVLGVLLADGFYAAELNNGQEVKNVFRDLREYGLQLNVEEEIVARNKELSELVEFGRWEDIKQVLQITYQSLRNDFKRQKDEALIVFFDLGLWFRLMQISVSVFGENLTSEGKIFLEQKSEVVDNFIMELDTMPSKNSTDDFTSFLRDNLVLLQAEFEGVLTEEAAKRILEIMNLVVSKICSKN